MVKRNVSNYLQIRLSKLVDAHSNVTLASLTSTKIGAGVIGVRYVCNNIS